MQIELGNRLVDNNLTKEELESRVTITLTQKEDYDDICITLAKAFNLSKEEVGFQLVHSKVLIDQSIKLIDVETNEIYGLLTFCEYPISYGSPLMKHCPVLGKFLLKYPQINGHAFVIDERLRGLGYDKIMLNFNKDYLGQIFDFIWCAVEKDLKSHKYWQRFGFMKFFSIKEASFYIMPLRKSWLDDIYKYASKPSNDEKNNCKRRST